MNGDPRVLALELPLDAAEAERRVTVPFPHPAWLTLRTAGDMRDRSTRVAVLEAMGISAERVCMVRQTHSTTVLDAADLVRAGSTAAADE